ncbi:MAG: helix-turn-helix transcriptional regulator [Gaiellaceae bacterium]
MALRTDTKLLQVAVSVERRTDRDRVLTALRHPEIAVAPAGREPDALVLAAAPAGRDRWPSVAAARESTRAALVCVIDQADWRGVRAIVGQGANAVVLREDVERTLAAAVLAAASGQLVLPSVLAGQIARPALSPREKQVLGMVVMGLRNAEIAQTLYISETTVKSHLAAAFSKLGVRSRSEASALILDPENGLGIGILEISGEGAGTRQAALPGVR